MRRRTFLTSAAAVAALPRALSAAEPGNFPVTRTEAEWKAMLSEQEYDVMREMGTERAFTSPLNDIKADGIFHCKGCDQAVYSSETKFDSGTGWPSFYEALPDSVGTQSDRSFFMVRTEVHCDRCGSHLGHIFDDGPEPTGKRHCINGVSLTFTEA
ncbi:peptide-methionine (R)-S-oxide reductase [Palleronia aestuarii]|uniref:peptide-methionine (R)-S-oxide reductase n=1 Tax=Palleronia aestuarii TaxID=568105 RepID=A0A2W7NYG6_9RHOB|nr:peptide-methionine (R)-S-oxide reductase MsrB [Palleronia aestuarii]PZX16242.1 peptide-methionine (R)-S-oxide reductase [Palleronia aestuarii]